MIADQDELSVRSFDVVEQLREFPGGCHAGFVDHQHARPGKWRPVAEVVEQRGGARRFDARARSEFAGGAARDGDAQHRVTGVLPRLTGRGSAKVLPVPALPATTTTRFGARQT